VEASVDELPSSYQVGSVLFKTDQLKLALVQECKAWKRAFGAALNEKAGSVQEKIFAFMENLSKRLKYDVLINLHSYI